MTEFFIAVFAIAYFLVLGYILFENNYRCSYCGGLFFGKSKWSRKGMYLHPENIVNECIGCARKPTLTQAEKLLLKSVEEINHLKHTYKDKGHSERFLKEVDDYFKKDLDN